MSSSKKFFPSLDPDIIDYIKNIDSKERVWSKNRDIIDIKKSKKKWVVLVKKSLSSYFSNSSEKLNNTINQFKKIIDERIIDGQEKKHNTLIYFYSELLSLHSLIRNDHLLLFK